MNEKKVNPVARVDDALNFTSASHPITSVLFHPSPKGRAGAPLGENGGVSTLVFAGPRQLLRPNHRRRLRRTLAKAFYGKRYDQSHQRSRSGNWKNEPVGMRLQHFALSASGQLTAQYASW